MRLSSIQRDGLAVGIATGFYGISFGAVSVAAGFDVVQTCLSSLLIFTGASQFALVGVVASGGSALSGAATALMLGTRNTLYGLRLAPLLRLTGWQRYGGAQIVIDESTAMSVSRGSTADARTGFWWTGLSVFVLWNVFTLVGALAGEAIGDPADFGLDAAVGAAFLALLWARLDNPLHRVIAVLAAALALGLVPIATAGLPIIAAVSVALLTALLPEWPPRDPA